MLIFLPGLGEIYHVMDMIADDKKLQEYDLDLVPLHSTLSDTNQ
jgi:HrpA-like RNA helicase